MTIHLEGAAAKAVELADELVELDGPTASQAGIRAAAHLTYLAGLLRGGVVRRIEELSVAVPVSDEAEPFRVKSWTAGEASRVDESAELAMLRAERGRAGEEIFRLQRALNAKNEEFQRAKLAHANQLAALRDQVKAGAETQRRLTDQRNDLLDAARQAAAWPSPEHLKFLRETTERIVHQCSTPAEQAARLWVE